MTIEEDGVDIYSLDGPIGMFDSDWVVYDALLVFVSAAAACGGAEHIGS